MCELPPVDKWKHYEAEEGEAATPKEFCLGKVVGQYQMWEDS